jgi:hypothetical protein
VRGCPARAAAYAIEQPAEQGVAGLVGCSWPEAAIGQKI